MSFNKISIIATINAIITAIRLIVYITSKIITGQYKHLMRKINSFIRNTIHDFINFMNLKIIKYYRVPNSYLRKI